MTWILTPTLLSGSDTAESAAGHFVMSTPLNTVLPVARDTERKPEIPRPDKTSTKILEIVQNILKSQNVFSSVISKRLDFQK